jgi:hypothetical protein
VRINSILATVVAVAALLLGITGCDGSNQNGTAGGSGAATPTAAMPAPSSPEPSSPSSAANVTAALIWQHFGKFFNEPQVWYVARLTNPGDQDASIALEAKALDASGAIVGHSGDTLPTIPAHGSFDYFGYIGGGAATNTALTGVPVKVEVEVPDLGIAAGQVPPLPLLGVSEVRLRRTTADTYTEAKYGYGLTALVTNLTGQNVQGITQQVILYDASGTVVGGDTGSSDNAPESARPGEKWRERWDGIPAIAPAVRAEYSAWSLGLTAR